jgi:hypothetical protein
MGVNSGDDLMTVVLLIIWRTLLLIIWHTREAGVLHMAWERVRSLKTACGSVPAPHLSLFRAGVPHNYE